VTRSSTIAALPFVSRVLIEQRTHLEKIVTQDGLARSMMVFWYCGNAMDARMMMIEITIINSSRVNRQ